MSTCERNLAQLPVKAPVMSAPHPVEALQAKINRDSERESRVMMSSLAMGPGFEIRHRMETAIVSQIGRLPGLPSSRVALDTLLGNDEDIGFGDILGVEEHVGRMVSVDTHMAMEAKLKL